MRILVTGQVSVHWGRVEFGNIGNYYIVETTFRELHNVFSGAEIVTTFQMTEEFCKRENVTVLPLELFYSWSEDDLNNAYKDFAIADIYNKTNELLEMTPFIAEVLKCDLIIDFSGEMWGDHAEPVGRNRFLVGLLKDRTAQLLNKKVVLLGGSQGPFTNSKIKEFAKIVFRDFNLIANRESASRELLEANGFDVTKVKNYACPAFLFEPLDEKLMSNIFDFEGLFKNDKPTVGFILCGFNFTTGPYDKWPRQDEEYINFAEAIEFLINVLNVKVVLMSHQNGFEFPPNFKLIQGRDYPIVKQLYECLIKRNKIEHTNLSLLKRPYLPNETKAIIKKYDMFITGRVHGFVASVSQCVPTVLITRGFGGISHRNIGFARSVGLEDYIADPGTAEDIIYKIKNCWANREAIRKYLIENIPQVKEEAKEAFRELKKLF